MWVRIEEMQGGLRFVIRKNNFRDFRLLASSMIGLAAVYRAAFSVNEEILSTLARNIDAESVSFFLAISEGRAAVSATAFSENEATKGPKVNVYGKPRGTPKAYPRTKRKDQS